MPWVTIQAAPLARTKVMEREGKLVLALVDATSVDIANTVLDKIAALVPTKDYNWTQLLIDTDLELVRVGQASAVILELEPGSISGASIGNTSAWWIDDFGVENLTERQIEKSMLGDGNSHPYAFRVRGLEGGRVLVATSALVGVGKDAIMPAAREPDLTAASKALAQLATSTFILCQG
ncbi:MAG: hypothetical protein QM831_38020 [Kofleriaceae bacterium]